MTDSPSPADPGPVDPDVELASAHLDGEAGPEERARVGDPAVAAHLAGFGRVTDQVRDVPPPPAGLLDDHVARAMASFDDEGRVVPIGATSVTPWWQRIPLGAVAAVLIVVALVGVASLGGFDGDDDDDTATAAFDTADDSGDERIGAGGDSGGAQEPMADAMEESATFESGAGPDRARFDSYDDLAADLRDELDAPTTGEAADDQDAAGAERSAGDGEAGEGQTDPCDAVTVAGIDPVAVVLVRAAVVGSDDVTVVVHDAEDGRRLAVVDDATCTVVLDRLL